MKYEIKPLTEEEETFIEEKINVYGDSMAPSEPHTEEEQLVFKVEDEDKNVIGGCVVNIHEMGRAVLAQLWVDERYRHHGLGSMLIRATEDAAREKGCYYLCLGTMDFQAKPFYENRGYTVNDTMSGVPKGHEHYFMTKRLDRSVTQRDPSNPNQYEIIPGSEEDAKFLSGRLRRHDEAFAPREHEYVSIGKKVMNENGRIIVGLVGGVDGWNGTDIDALWVDDPYRRQGIGTRLLRQFEREAKENGANVVFIEAYDWNVGFFRKNGYETVTGMLEDYPKGHTMYCMQKPL